MSSHVPHLALSGSRHPSHPSSLASAPLVLQCCHSSSHSAHPPHYWHTDSPSTSSLSGRSISSSPASPIHLRSSASMYSFSSTASSSPIHAAAAAFSGSSRSPSHSRSNSTASSTTALTSSSHTSSNFVVTETPDANAVATLGHLISGELRELLLLYADKTLSPFDEQGYWNCCMSHLTAPAPVAAGDAEGPQHDVPLCDKRFVKSSRRSCRAHLWSCLVRHYPSFGAYDIASFHQLCLKAHAHVLIRAFQVTTLFSRNQRPRRNIDTQPSAETWTCPLGCGQSYLLSNHASIRTHLDNGCCPLTPSSQRSLPRRQSLMTRPSSFNSIASIGLTSPRSAGRLHMALPLPELPSNSLYPVLDSSMISTPHVHALSPLDTHVHISTKHFSPSMHDQLHDPSNSSSSLSPSVSSYSITSPSVASHATLALSNASTSPLRLNLSNGPSPSQEALVAFSPPHANQNARPRHSQLPAGLEVLGPSAASTTTQQVAQPISFPHPMSAHPSLMSLATEAALDGDAGGERMNDMTASLHQTIADRLKLDHIIQLLTTQTHTPLSPHPLSSSAYQQTLRQLLAELSPEVHHSLLHALAFPSNPSRQ